VPFRGVAEWIHAYKPPTTSTARQAGAQQEQEPPTAGDAKDGGEGTAVHDATFEAEEEEVEDLNHGLTIPLQPPDGTSGFWEQSNMD
jgi:hypothetical protein